MWGIDMCMYPYGNMNMILVPYIHVRHYFSSKFDNCPYYKEMLKELKNMNKLFPKNIKFKF
jgi:hypothetical protein